MRVAMAGVWSGLFLAVFLAPDVGASDAALTDQRFSERTRVYQRQRAERPLGSGGMGPPRGEAPYRRKLHSPPGRFFHPSPAQPLVSHGGWFQRPYPYHLDYYRLRYGGTYEPYYSGGLYGTPQVIAPPGYGYGYGYAYGSPYGYAPPTPPVPDGDPPRENPSDP